MAVANLLIGLLLGIAGAGPPSRSELEILQQAETAFHEGLGSRERPEQARQHFRKAAALYETLRQHGANNAALHRNLGNACLLAGDLPRALLAYQHGLRLTPGDRHLEASLSYARAQVAYPDPGGFGRPPEEHWVLGLSHGWSRGRLLLAVLLYSLSWLAFTRWRMVRQGWLWYGVGGSLAGTMLMAASLSVHEWDRWRAAHYPLVVIAEDGVLLRKGNGLAYPPSYEQPLNRGVEARLRFARGDWLQIELAGGEVGWVPRGYAIVDSPDGIIRSGRLSIFARQF